MSSPSSKPAPTDPQADSESGEELLEAILAEPARPERIDGVVVGVIRGFDGEGQPLVAFAPAPSDEPVRARSTVALVAEDAGAEVALLFEQGDPARPIVMGKMHKAAVTAPLAADLSANVDGKRISLSAEEQIELRCGESSIVLTRAGKILIKGAYVLTRSTGVNRILGGSVQIN